MGPPILCVAVFPKLYRLPIAAPESSHTWVEAPLTPGIELQIAKGKAT